MVGEELFDALRHVALEVVLGLELGVILESERADAGLALGALLPALLGALVAADVDVLRGEELHDLGQNPLEELEGLVVAGAEHLLGHAPFAPHLVGAARAAQLGVGGQCGEHVARKVDFGNHRDAVLGGVGHHVAHLILRVVSAVGGVVGGAPLLADHRMAAEGAHLRQTGVALDFEAPALVVGQVPVQRVELVQRHDVDDALHLVDREEVARDVEVLSAVGEAGCILDAEAGHRPCDGLGGRSFAVDGHGQQLLHRLDGIEHAALRRGAHRHQPARDIQTVALGRLERIVEEEESLRCGVSRAHLRRLAAGRLKLFGEVPDGLAGRLVQLRVTGEGCPCGVELARAGFERIGIGNQVVAPGVAGACRQKEAARQKGSQSVH